MTGILPQQKNILTGFVRSGCFFSPTYGFKKFEKKSAQPIPEQSSFTFWAAAATSWLTG